jgi:ribokinase
VADRGAPPDVLVVGSLNADLVLRVGALPAPGETVLASGRTTGPGGKGGNQAVAAARAGARTAILAAVGDDDAGTELTDGLAAAGVAVGAVRTVRTPTGLAVVMVDDSGENAIVVAAGANAALIGLSPQDRALISGAGVLLAQLEIPLATVHAAAAVARAAGTRVVLNAAPARVLPDDLLGMVDLLVVNELEARALAAGDPAGLLDRVAAIVVTRGSRGCRYLARDSAPLDLPAPRVRVVDTTGAGDAFAGQLAAALAEGVPVADALLRAVHAGALCVQRLGAAGAMPSRAEVLAALGR